MIEDYFGLSLKYMRYRKIRAWLTLIGVVIGIGAIVSLISLGQGLQNAVNEQFESIFNPE